MNPIKLIIKKICKKIFDINIQYHHEIIYEKFKFDKSVKFYNVSFEGNVKIGKKTYINEGSRIDSGVNSKISIGRHCAIGRNVHITSKTHDLKQPTTDLDHKNISHVENNVCLGNCIWIGDNVVILPGVTIEDYAVIGANSLVNRNVEKFEIVGGTPIKRIRFNTDHYKFPS